MRALMTAAVLVAAVAAPFTLDRQAVRFRAYNTTSAPMGGGVVNVHVVPHTHDDVGWLKTFQEYYLGRNNSIQHAGVQWILTSLVPALQANPDRKFNYVEQAFFQLWWDHQSPTTQETVKQLVANGQLQFSNGGHCMHDEASVLFVDAIDQTSLGHQLIADLFGPTAVPTTGAQHDPFGHSAAQASHFSAGMGFSGLYFGRADSQDIALRRNTSRNDFIWRPSASLGNTAQVFTGINSDNYGLPTFSAHYPTYAFDVATDTEAQPAQFGPIQDDPEMDGYNVLQYVNATLVLAARQVAYSLRDSVDNTVHIKFDAGMDFEFEAAHENYGNLDKLIHYVNLNTSIHGVNMLYSTPALYTASKLSQRTAWPLETHDFFPYINNPHWVWTGYFSSRPAFKGYVRDSSSYYTASRQLQAWGAGGAPAGDGPSNPLYRLARAMGTAQHHDAVTGTERQHVAYDYAATLAAGRSDADLLLNAALTSLTGTGSSSSWTTCELANATICAALEAGQPTMLLVHNSQSADKLNHPVRVPVGLPAGVASWTVLGVDGRTPLQAQLLPISMIDEHLRSSYYGVNSSTPMQWLATMVPRVPAMGYSILFLQPSATVTGARTTVITPPVSMRTGVGLRGLKDQIVSNGFISLTISAATGMVSSYTNAVTGVTLPLTQTLLWYNASTGNAANDGTNGWQQASDTYIFRPNSSTPLPVNPGNAPAIVDVVTGPVVTEVRQRMGGGNWVSQVISLWTNHSVIQTEWTVGPIPVSDGFGKEVISRWSSASGLDNSPGILFTDSQGLEMQRRVLNQRPTFNVTIYEPVAANYYPVTSRAHIEDGSSGVRLTVSPDRSQGCASLTTGAIECMLHRRLLVDNMLGNGEALNEPGLDWTGSGLIARGVVRISIDTPSTKVATGHRLAGDSSQWALQAYAPLPAGTTPAQWVAGAGHVPAAALLATVLPAPVSVLTVQSRGPTQLLLRLLHAGEVADAAAGNGTDPAWYSNVTVSLASLFTSFTITSAEETSLGGVVPLTAVPQWTLQAQGEAEPVTLPAVPPAPAGPQLTITLGPQQVRTFLCTTTQQ